jgi:hypothetical protein
MANQIKRPSKSQYRAMDLVEEWLHIDSLANPSRRSGLYRNNAYARSKAIYRQVRAKWETFQDNIEYVTAEQRSDETKTLYLGRLVLDATSFAQHGYILGDIVRGGNTLSAMDESWHKTQDFKKHVRAGHIPLPPVENLGLSIDAAIKSYTQKSFEHPLHTYIGMFAYSAVLVDHFKDDFAKEFILPTPGQPEGELHRWGYDPQ